MISWLRSLFEFEFESPPLPRMPRRKPTLVEWPNHPCKCCGATTRICVDRQDERGGTDRKCAYCGGDNDWVPEPVTWMYC